MNETPARRTRKPANESKVFQPSSFASRKAAADAQNAARAEPRIVSMGATEFTQRTGQTGEVEIVSAQLFCDVDHPVDRWIEIDGTPGRHSLNSDDRREQVTKLPPLKGRTRGLSAMTQPSNAVEQVTPIT